MRGDAWRRCGEGVAMGGDGWRWVAVGSGWGV